MLRDGAGPADADDGALLHPYINSISEVNGGIKETQSRSNKSFNPSVNLLALVVDLMDFQGCVRGRSMPAFCRFL